MLGIATDQKGVIGVDEFGKGRQAGIRGDCSIVLVVDTGDSRWGSKVIECSLIDDSVDDAVFWEAGYGGLTCWNPSFSTRGLSASVID